MFIGYIVLIVLVVLCIILGAIYAYIYFTRINPARGRKFADIGGGGGGGGGGGHHADGGEGGGGRGTHMLLNFR